MNRKTSKKDSAIDKKVYDIELVEKKPLAESGLVESLINGDLDEEEFGEKLYQNYGAPIYATPYDKEPKKFCRFPDAVSYIYPELKKIQGKCEELDVPAGLRPFLNEKYRNGYVINTGRAGLFVVDLDVKEKDGTNGIEMFEKLCADHGFDPDVETLTMRSANGGRHYYFSVRDGYAFGHGTVGLAEGIDVRTGRSWIVGPGSYLEVEEKDEEGKVVSKSKKYYTVSKKLPIAPLPDWIADLYIMRNMQKKVGNRTKAIGELKPVNAEMKRYASVEELDGFQKKVWTDTLKKISAEAEKRRKATEAEKKEFNSRHSFVLHIGNKLGFGGICLTTNPELLEIATEACFELYPNDSDYDEQSRTLLNGNSYTTPFYDPKVSEGYIPAEHADQWNQLGLPEPWEMNGWEAVDLVQVVINNIDLIFDSGASDWYLYNNKYFMKATKKQIQSSLQKFVNNIREMINVEENPKCKTVYNYLGRRQYIQDLMFYLEGEVVLEEDQAMRGTNINFDIDPELICVKNGMVNLRTKELLPHDPKYRARKYIDVNYNPDATHEAVEQVISAITPDAREWMKLMFGQALTGMQTEKHYIFFLAGSGGNGKSILVKALKQTSGSYGMTPSKEMFLEKGDKFAKAGVNETRALYVEEVPDKYLDVVSIKDFVGTPTFTLRLSQQNPIEVNNLNTVFLTFNRAPKANTTDEATWRRLKKIDCPFDFTGTGKGIPAEAIPGIFKTIETEEFKEAFLAMRVDYAQKWLLNPELESEIPASVVKATNEWKAESNTSQQFFNEMLIEDPEYCVSKENLYKSYSQWVDDAGYKALGKDRFCKVEIPAVSNAVLCRNKRSDVISYPSNCEYSIHGDRGVEVLRGIRFRTEMDDIEEFVEEMTPQDFEEPVKKVRPLDVESVVEDKVEATVSKKASVSKKSTSTPQWVIEEESVVEEPDADEMIEMVFERDLLFKNDDLNPKLIESVETDSSIVDMFEEDGLDEIGDLIDLPDLD